MRWALPLILLTTGLQAAVEKSKRAPWREKEIGVILASDSGGPDFERLVSKLRKDLGAQTPLETFTGPVATRDMQRSIDRLQRARVRKIVVIPLALHSNSPEIEQMRYILGLRRYPSELFLNKWRMRSNKVPRARLSVPLVMGGALNHDPLVASILTDRAMDMSRSPSKESVVLIAQGAPEDGQNAPIEKNLYALAQRVQQEGGFREVHAAPIRPATKKRPRQRDENIQRLRALIRKLSAKSRVILVPHLVLDDGMPRRWKKELDNLFYLWRGKTLLPDMRIAQWVRQQINRAKTKPSMVQFKDSGQQLPSEPGKRIVQ